MQNHIARGNFASSNNLFKTSNFEMPCQTVLVGSDKSQRFTNTGRSNGGRPPYKRSLRIMKVSFDENELDTIPWDIPPGCCELSVGNNELECVSWDRAEPKLQALICHHNVIQKIHPMILVSSFDESVSLTIT